MTQNNINNSASDLTIDNLFIDGNTISSTDTNGNVVLAPDGTGVVSVTTAAIVPSGDRADSLGSTTNSWDNLYCDGVSFDDGTNVLAIYDKDTFTPVLEFGGGTTGITYSSQIGTYWKIGTIIVINIVLVLTNKGSSTGTATITGLPFTSANDGYTHIFMLAGTNLTNTTSCTQFYGYNVPNTSSIQIRNCGSSADAQLTDGEFANNSEVKLSGFYWDS